MSQKGRERILLPFSALGEMEVREPGKKQELIRGERRGE